MSRRVWVICILLAVQPCAGLAHGCLRVRELIADGARLDPATAKAYADAYKSNPKALALVRKASAK